jgi:predicted site-specific integrase-resolvase
MTRLELLAAAGKTPGAQLDPVLSPAEACAELGISKKTWHRHWRHKVPVIQLSPGRVGVRRSDLLAALEARCKGGS